MIEKKLSIDNSNFGIKERNIIELKRCQREDFFFLIQEKFDSSLSNFNCLEKKEIFLKGDFDQNLISQVLITLNLCNNQTSNFSCKTPEEINNFFQDPKKIVFSYIDFNEDVENFENPIVKNFKYETYEIDSKKKRQELINLKQTFFKTKSGLFDERNIVSIKLDEKKGDFFDFLSDSNVLVSITLQASKRYEKITRTYQSIGEGLASSFSLIKVIMIVMKVFMCYLSKIKIKLHLVNKLYDFDMKEGKKEFYSKQEYKKKEKLKKVKGQTRFKFSICQAVIAEIKSNFFKKRTSHNEKLYLESENIVQRDTNLTYIIQKLHEIEKIKLLIFNDNQRFLFNFFTKPVVYLPNYQNKSGPNKKLSDSLNLGEQNTLNMEECKKNLKEIIKSMSYSHKDMDRKLLMYLDERMEFLKDNNFTNFRMSHSKWRRFTIS